MLDHPKILLVFADVFKDAKLHIFYRSSDRWISAAPNPVREAVKDRVGYKVRKQLKTWLRDEECAGSFLNFVFPESPFKHCLAKLLIFFSHALPPLIRHHHRSKKWHLMQTWIVLPFNFQLSIWQESVYKIALFFRLLLYGTWM